MVYFVLRHSTKSACRFLLESLLSNFEVRDSNPRLTARWSDAFYNIILYISDFLRVGGAAGGAMRRSWQISGAKGGAGRHGCCNLRGKSEVMLRFLFPYRVYPRSVDAMLLALRLLFGGLMVWHGVSKIENFTSLVANFPNPIGLGSRLSLYLAIFSEVICSVAVIVGAFYRLALIPLIFTMGVAMIVVHNGQSFAAKELALIFLVIFVLLFLMGAGRYSLDNMISVQIHDVGTCTEKGNGCAASGVAMVADSTPRQQDSAPPTDDVPHQ